jgi:TP901 family phage tail tape measure protein
MPDLTRTIEIVFDGVDRTNGAIRAVNDDLGNLTGGASQAIAPLTAVADALIAFEVTAAAAGAALAAMAVTAAGQFNSAFAEIATLTGQSTDSLSQFRGELLNYASQSSSTFESITSATYAAVSAGVAYADSVQFVSDAERLAIASKADLDATVTLLASTLNSYGASADQAARYSDVLFTTVRTGQTTLPELASSLSQVTGLASSAGIPIETLTSAIAELTASGLPTSEAITAIKAAISNLIKPTAGASEAAAQLGVSFGAQALKAQGLDGVLLALAQATGGNTAEMARFFDSTEALNGVLTLTRNNGQSWIDKLGEMQTATGAVSVAYTTMADNFDLVNQRIRNSVTALLIEAGTPLEQQWAEVGAAIAGIFAAIRSSIDEGAFADVYAAIAQFGIDLTANLRAIADSIPAAFAGLDFSPLLASFGAISTAVSELFAGVDLTTPEGLRAAMQGLIDVGAGLNEAFAGLVEGITPFLREIANGIAQFGQLNPEMQAAAW